METLLNVAVPLLLWALVIAWMRYAWRSKPPGPKRFPPLNMIDQDCYEPTDDDRYGRFVLLGGKTLNNQEKEHRLVFCYRCGLVAFDCRCIETLIREGAWERARWRELFGPTPPLRVFMPNPVAFSENETPRRYHVSLHARDTTVDPLTDADRELLKMRTTHGKREPTDNT